MRILKGLRRLLQRLTKFAIGLGEIFIEAGVDIIWIPDDLGTVDGPFLSPNTFRHMIFPYFREIVDSFKKHGVKVLLHCDGQVMPLVDDLIEIGIDGLHPIERKAGMNLAEIKAKYGDKLTLIGNVDATEVLPHGTEEDIKKQVIECLKMSCARRRLHTRLRPLHTRRSPTGKRENNVQTRKKIR